jgi:hypothetical protein
VLLLVALADAAVFVLLRPLAPHPVKDCMRVSIGCQPSLPRRSELWRLSKEAVTIAAMC